MQMICLISYQIEHTNLCSRSTLSIGTSKNQDFVLVRQWDTECSQLLTLHVQFPLQFQDSPYLSCRVIDLRLSLSQVHLAIMNLNLDYIRLLLSIVTIASKYINLIALHKSRIATSKIIKFSNLSPILIFFESNTIEFFFLRAFHIYPGYKFQKPNYRRILLLQYI